MTISFKVALVSDGNIQKTLTAIQQMLLKCGELVRSQQFAEVNLLAQQIEQGMLHTLAMMRTDLGFPDLRPTPQLGQSPDDPAP